MQPDRPLTVIGSCCLSFGLIVLGVLSTLAPAFAAVTYGMPIGTGASEAGWLEESGHSSWASDMLFIGKLGLWSLKSETVEESIGDDIAWKWCPVCLLDCRRVEVKVAIVETHMKCRC